MTMIVVVNFKEYEDMVLEATIRKDNLTSSWINK